MNEPFHNDPIPIDHLPQLSADDFISVDPRYVRVSLVGIAITAAVVAVIGGIVASQATSPTIVFAIVLGILLILGSSAVYRVFQVRRLAYQLRDHDVSLRSGVINHQVESMPFSRVQHVNINRGPLERSLGLATLHISSAGPDISIPGLSDSDAERIKMLVTKRAGVDDDGSTSGKGITGEAPRGALAEPEPPAVARPAPLPPPKP